MDEIIKRVWTNLKNWSSWDFSDFRLTKEEGKAVQEVLRFYLTATVYETEILPDGRLLKKMAFIEEIPNGCEDKA